MGGSKVISQSLQQGGGRFGIVSSERRGDPKKKVERAPGSVARAGYICMYGDDRQQHN